MLAGGAALIILTLLDLWQADRYADSGGQLMMMTPAVPLLFWRERAALNERVRRSSLFGVAALVLLAPIYIAARRADLATIEFLAAWGMVLLVAWMELGTAVPRRLWFPILFSLFLAPPPGNVLFILTHQLKLWLTHWAVQIAAACGLAAGATGTIIQVDGYQLSVAAACSGINSLVGIGALSLLYAYLRHANEPIMAAALCVLMLPIAILANLLRILILIGATHWLGDEAVQSIAHPLAGLGVFALAVSILFAVDNLLARWLARRRCA